MLGQAFALEHSSKLASAIWCDTLPSTPAGAPEVWQQRVDTVRNANSLAPLADPTIERWLTDAVKQQRPGRWKQIRDTIIGTTPAGYLGCVAAIRNFDFIARLPSVKLPVLVVCGAEDAGTPPVENRRIATLVPGARYEEIASARHFPNVEHPDTFNRIMLGWLQSQS
jgi:3-oxoadipate enol-lactonase